MAGILSCVSEEAFRLARPVFDETGPIEAGVQSTSFSDWAGNFRFKQTLRFAVVNYMYESDLKRFFLLT